MSDAYERAAEAIRDGTHIVAATGAGISVESGIPHFRGEGGIWLKYPPDEYATLDAYVSDPYKVWEFWRELGATLVDCQPNPAHHALAELERQGRLHAVITQNVDNLHQDSGVPGGQVIELHGNATYAKCLACGTTIGMSDIEREYRESGRVGPCSSCGGIVKSATISFGQLMPEEPMRRAEAETLACDLFIVLGSSLSIFPAAGFPWLAREKGASLAIVNREPTEMDALADVVIHDGIGVTMETLLGMMAARGRPG